MTESETPLLDQLEEGPWPSFVTEMKRAGEKNRPTIFCASWSARITKRSVTGNMAALLASAATAAA